MANSNRGRQQLIVATGNPNKVREIETFLKGLSLEVISSLELPGQLPVKEDQSSYEGNALKKAEAVRAVAAVRGAIVMADDSGLEVEALQGRPGVQAARFAGSDADARANNALLLEKMRGLPPEKRGATFKCVIAVIFPDGKTCLVKESCSGRISENPRGEQGFGYDPLFVYEPAGLTFAEIGAETKNRVSHRGKALRKVRRLIGAWLKRTEGAL